MPTQLTYHPIPHSPAKRAGQPHSIIQFIDENGNVIEETNYGPWGRYRNPNTWQYDNT